MITASDFDTDVTGKVDMIIDVMGHYSNQTTQAGSTTENVFVAAPVEAAMGAIGTMRLNMCKRQGGLPSV